MADVSGPTISQANASTTAPSSGSLDWVSLASGALSLYNQQRLADTNIKRAKQGLPPITIDQIPGAVPSVNVGVEGKTLGVVGALGIGALAIFGLSAFLKRKR